MKNLLNAWFLILLAACSAPRYTYYFDRTSAPTKPPVLTADLSPAVIYPPVVESPLPASPHEITNSNPDVTKGIPRGRKKEGPVMSKPKDTPASPAVKSTRMDSSLKLGILFSAGGIAAMTIGGPILLVIGTLSLIIGVIFVIKWALRQ